MKGAEVKVGSSTSQTFKRRIPSLTATQGTWCLCRLSKSQYVSERCGTMIHHVKSSQVTEQQSVY